MCSTVILSCQHRGLPRMEHLDDETVEQILSKLPASDLAEAQLTCKQWWNLISSRQLWRPHVLGSAITAGRNGTPASMQSSQCVDWRTMCLNRLAAQRWQSGKLVHLATLQGHTSNITSVATLDNIVLTGSSDCTARLWYLEHHGTERSATHQHNRQQQHRQTAMKHSAPVVAVEIVSVDLCVTATASQARLWRRGAAVRCFEVMPGGSITSIALTDTQLLLGSTASTVQQFDLYSGAQQLITRYERGVTALLTFQQKRQQQQEGIGQDWSVLVGTADGQVVCSSCSTGQQLWKLPNRYPAAVVAFNITDECSTQQQHHQQSHWRKDHHHQQQRAGKSQGHLQDTHQKQQQQLVLVLNSRSQLICWKLPSNSNSSSNLSSAWPLTMLNLQGSQTLNVLSGAAAIRSACMACPSFGSRYLIFGSNAGNLTVAELAQSDRGSSRSRESTAAGDLDGRVDSDKGKPAAAAAATFETRQGTTGALESGGLGCMQQDNTRLSGIASSGVADSPDHQTQQIAAQHSGLELQMIRCCSLNKLAKVLAFRTPTKTASSTHGISSSGSPGGRSSSSAISGSQRGSGPAARSTSCLISRGTQAVGVRDDGVHVGVNCIAFTGTGGLVVGLESGHVCLLKFKQRQLTVGDAVH